jgi:hypothetical protein
MPVDASVKSSAVQFEGFPTGSVTLEKVFAPILRAMPAVAQFTATASSSRTPLRQALQIQARVSLASAQRFAFAVLSATRSVITNPRLKTIGEGRKLLFADWLADRFPHQGNRRIFAGLLKITSTAAAVGMAAFVSVMLFSPDDGVKQMFLAAVWFSVGFWTSRTWA